MHAKIQSQGFEVTAAIEAKVRRQLNRALDRFGADILAVDVFLSDVNGPRGEATKKR